jgi:peroxiredoxin Q/BCP
MKWVLIALVLIVALLVLRTIARGRVLRPGDAAPEFSLPDQNGATRALGDFRDRWLALYFFPRADTPG